MDYLKGERKKERKTLINKTTCKFTSLNKIHDALAMGSETDFKVSSIL